MTCARCVAGRIFHKTLSRLEAMCRYHQVKCIFPKAGTLAQDEASTARGPNVDQFMELYTAYESRLRGYVLSLVPKWSDAEEISQRCSFLLWKKFDQFEPGTNFYGWACQIARLEVKDFRKRAARERIIFSDEFIDTVADEAVEMNEEFPERSKALQKCIEQLPKNQRELLRLRYDERRSVVSVAKVVNKPIEGVYKALSRIRQALHFCIDSRLEAGEP